MEKTDLWIQLRNRGHSPDATAAIMGNIEAESAFRPNNVEDRSKLTDAEYTTAVDDGRISRDSFMRDALGYGLCQWTYFTRKAGLYDLCRQRGVSISDTPAQLDYLGMELAEHEYQPVKRALDSDASLYEKTRMFMVLFERPADQSQEAINYRVGLAQAIYNELSGISLEKPADSAGHDAVKPEFWPPRGYVGGVKDPGLCFGMEGPDVMVLQSILYARDYNPGTTDGIFSGRVKTALLAFQAEHGLDPDGICGPKTWRQVLNGEV